MYEGKHRFRNTVLHERLLDSASEGYEGRHRADETED